MCSKCIVGKRCIVLQGPQYRVTIIITGRGKVRVRLDLNMLRG